MLARNTSGIGGVPVFQAPPVFHTEAMPPRARTTALVSGVRFAMTLVL
ncbi:hypothetical protein SALBM311S_07229 [Streptomyces alboniger]